MKNRARPGKHNIRLTLMLCIAAFMVLASVFAGFFAPNDPLESHYDAILQAPSSSYPCGTDQLGRCIFSRILYGGRTSLLIAFIVVAIVASVGILIGIVAGFSGGFADNLIMRIVDMLMAFPGTVFVIAVVSVLGTSLQNIIIAMTAIGWTYYARISRSLALSLRKNEYIIQARLGGASFIRITFHYVLPNIIPFFLVIITQDIGDKLLSIAALSLLGLGSQPPTPEWGFMLSEGKKFMQTAPWMLVFPGMAILINVIVYNLLGDMLRDALDPKNIC